ncbi:MAG: hypothetical protein M1817_001443 [Caeruleum heppii]|nr:MAG: hypothetical protein M1817_001443 [Caeruleum heppii]
MKLRRRPSPLLFLLLPYLVSAAAALAGDSRSDQQPVPRDGPVSGPAVTPSVPPNPKLKSDVGTKDAPVDGLDGKPHAGPWVDAGTDKKKSKSDGSTTATKKPAPRPASETAIPESNDGVMDDPNRLSPKKGTTGTEGGVSEKDRDRKAQEGQTGERTEKRPDPPKEAPPLPHSEEEKIKGAEGGGKGSGKNADKELDKPSTPKNSEKEGEKDPGGLEKPADLPEKPFDAPIPVPPSRANPLSPSKGDTLGQVPIANQDSNAGLIQPLHSFILSLTMILFSEVGDKTFLVAALMAMKHPRMVVFSAAFSALIAMTILSAVLGHAVPTLIPKRFTSFLAAGLFLIFGAKMLREGFGMRADEGVGEEMREVEMELEEKEHLARSQGRRISSVSPYSLESGLGGTRKSRSNSRLPDPPRSPSSSRSRSGSPSTLSSATTLLAGLNNLFSFLLSPAWVQTFIMTFLGEWGDRSQIATIAMAAGQDYWWVTAGAVLGHAVCTAAAVVGGRAIAGKVSLRVVTLGGAFAFVAFGFIYLLEALYYD